MGGRLEFQVLGSLMVVRGGTEVVIPRRRQRLVLARLLVDAGRIVPATHLMEDIWGTSDPQAGTGPLRTNVWELRRLLDAGTDVDGGAEASAALVSRQGGYSLQVDRDQVDGSRLEDRVAQARAAGPDEPERALASLDEGLGSWRGRAFGDLAGEPALQPEATGLDQLVLEAQELRADRLLGLGRHAQVAVELGALARANPERERLWALLMTALYRSGRQSEALRCYQEARTSLVDVVGVEPGPELRQLEQAVLRHDPALQWQPRPDPRTRARRRLDVVDGGRRGPAAEGAEPRRTAPSAQPRNLPRPFTSLVGREAERKAVAEALTRSRLVTLVGTGGCGKTRLASAVAAEDVLSRFPGGVWWVDLASVISADLLPDAIAAALGDDGNGAVADRFAGRGPQDGDEALLVLDNCEHIVDAVAEQVLQMLAQNPSLRILATSREELRLEGETVWRLRGLGLPSSSSGHPFLRSEAVELFVQRGAANLRGFAPSGETLELVAQICRRLDGLPLAIELAAALVGTLPVADIARRLDQRLASLAGQRGRQVARHQTLRAAFDWSFDLLDAPSQALFADLGVFVGTFTLVAVEAVAGDGDRRPTVADSLGHLVRTSMVESVAGRDGVERYRMLETVRQYSAERLATHDRADEVRRRHARYFADFATDADHHMRGAASSAWMQRVEAELPNLRAALAWAMSHGDVDVGLRILGSLRWLLTYLARPDELARWLDTATRRRSELPADLQLSLLTTTSTVAFLRGEHDLGRQVGAEAAAVARRLDDSQQLAVALVALAAAALTASDLSEAEEHLQEAQELCLRLGDRWGFAWTLAGWAVVSYNAGQPADARHQMEEALEAFRGLHDLHSQVGPLAVLALLALSDEQPERALSLAAEAVEIVTSLELDDDKHFVFGVGALVELAVGHVTAARDLFVESVRHFRGGQIELALTADFEGLALLAATADHRDAAAVLLGVAARLHRPLQPAPKWAQAMEAVLDLLRATLGPDQLERYLARGRQMHLDEALTLAEAATAALRSGPTPTDDQPSPPGPVVSDSEQTST